MMLLPIVHRELQVAARRRGTYRLRFWLVLAMLGMWLCLLRFGQSSLPASQQGQSLFIASGILALVFSLLAGAFLTADCLSEEKRDGTMGLLFLTKLKGYDVVLGKLVATSIHGFYGLLAVLPLLGLPLLMGSVTAGEFWRMALALATTLFFSLSIGMLVSALWLESRQTMTLTLVIVLLIAGLPPGLSWLASFWTKPMAAALPMSGPPPGSVWVASSSVAGGGWQILLAPSPLYLFWAGLEANYRAPAFWTSFCTIMALAGGALVFPSLYAPRAWRETGVAARAQSGGTWRRLRFGSAASRLRRRARLDVNPFYWLAGRDLTPRWTAWCLLGPLFCLWAGCASVSLGPKYLGTPNQQLCALASILTAYFMHQVLKYLVTVEAARRVSQERRSGAIEALLVTPISEGEIVAGQRRALASFFAGPTILVLVTNLVLGLGPAVVSLARGSPYHDAALFFVAGIGGAAILFFDLRALSLVGMSLAVKVPGHRQAVWGTLARVMLGPWLVVACLALMGGLLQSVAWECVICWLGASTLLDLTLADRAEEELIRGLRDHAPQSTAPENPPEPGPETAEPLAVVAGNPSPE